MRRIEIDIHGMTCEHCASTVTKHVEATGAVRCRVDLAVGRAEVDARDDAPSIPQLMTAVTDAGFTVGGFRQVRMSPEAAG